MIHSLFPMFRQEKKKRSSLPEASNVNIQDILELGIISHLFTNNDLCLPLPIVLIAQALLIAKDGR